MFKNSASSIVHRGGSGPLSPPMFDRSSSPVFETLAVKFLSTLLPNPSALPSLKTLAFLIASSPKKLTLFASDRKNTTLARRYHVVIVDEDGSFPSATSMAMGKHVPVADVRFGTELPKDPTRRGSGRFSVLEVLPIIYLGVLVYYRL